MKKLIAILLIISNITLVGCYSYKDINKLLFATAIVVDVVNDLPVIYVEAYKGVRDEPGQNDRVIFKGQGQTLMEAVKNLNLSASNEINYSQIKAIVFTENAANSDLEKFIDVLERNQQFVMRSFVCIFEGSGDELLDIKIPDEKFLGIFIHDLIKNVKTLSNSITLTLNDFLNKRVMPSKSEVATFIKLDRTNTKNKIILLGGAAIKDGIYKSRLNPDDTKGYNFLEGKSGKGVFQLANPHVKDSIISMEVLSNKTKTNFEYKDGTVYMYKNIKVSSTISQSQDKFYGSIDELEKLDVMAENLITKLCKGTFTKFKKKNLDIFDIENDFHRKYPNIKIDDIITKTELKINVDVNITDTAHIIN
ncbi:Ger(x)C family spore germination protein [Clostridium oceanicum]|uniref:Ger(X)C family spore germination protein n=1 Tax=Clostridium oceanicum TaxID=1543 RepID=A0ABN1JUQ0_9CLOT